MLSDKVFILSKNNQKAFMNQLKVAMKSKDISNVELATTLGVSTRTLYDWVVLKRAPDYMVLVDLCRYFNLTLPVGEIASKYRNNSSAGRVGAIKRHKLHGPLTKYERRRAKNWSRWWQMVGRHATDVIGKAKIITLPQRSPKLAEWTGIILGDGHVSQYQVSVTLNSADENYCRYVEGLTNKLFGLKTGYRYYKGRNAFDLVVSSKQLISYCKKELELSPGNKILLRSKLPDWIMNNSVFSVSALKGLVDTDGSFYYQEYSINNKKYKYPRINFSNKSAVILQQVYDILTNNLKIKCRQSATCITIDSTKHVKKYLLLVGTSSSRQLL